MSGTYPGIHPETPLGSPSREPFPLLAASEEIHRLHGENARLREQLERADADHQEFVAEILRNAGDPIPGAGESPEYRAQEYVRFLETVRGRLQREDADEPARVAVLDEIIAERDKAYRERDEARKAFTALASYFHKTDQGWKARIAGAVLHRLCVNAMCEPPDGSGQEADPAQELRSLIADILQSMPDTTDEPEWRDRAGQLGVTYPDGTPYRAWTEDDL